jgi:hypothetical protein
MQNRQREREREIEGKERGTVEQKAKFLLVFLRGGSFSFSLFTHNTYSSWCLGGWPML